MSQCSLIKYLLCSHSSASFDMSQRCHVTVFWASFSRPVYPLPVISCLVQASDWFPVTVLQYVLAVGSSVFGAMFYGDLAEGQSEIHIPDVEPAAFLILLK